jgi:hypothetical protein
MKAKNIKIKGSSIMVNSLKEYSLYFNKCPLTILKVLIVSFPPKIPHKAR